MADPTAMRLGLGRGAMIPILIARYSVLAKSPDRGQQRLAGAQLARLGRTSRPASAAHRPSRWAHVPLADLFAAAGNTLILRADGRVETGHEPVHRSRSGRCIVLWPAEGRWWCSSCRQCGDAASFLMAQRGWRYPQAAQWLAQHYGLPGTARRALQPLPTVEVP